MKKHIQIKGSYRIWFPSYIKRLIDFKAKYKFTGRYLPLIIEWWLHNIGYWVTKPFTAIPALKRINLRCKDVDLMVEVANED